MAKRKLSDVSLSDLRAELERRQEQLPKLRKQEANLEKQLADVRAQIAELEGSASGNGRRKSKTTGKTKATRKAKTRRRAKNKLPLPDALADALKGKGAVSVSDAIEAVKAAGYKTKAKASSFRTQVNSVLGKDKRFQKVERGIYKLKG